MNNIMKKSTDYDLEFICPKCGSSIKDGICAHCSFELRIDLKNIIKLTVNKDFYFREKMPRQLLRRIIDSQDIFKSAYQGFKLELKWKYDFYATDPNRGIGALLVNLNKDAVALDYGCGWGNIAKFMSNYAKHIVAMDMTYESLLFCKRTLGRDNVTFIHGGDGKYLPFADKTFDIVFLNGVLEWIPEYNNGEDPRDVQLRFLKEIKRILKPDGQAIIGIENRLGLNYFLGTPDEHSGLKYGTLLPRKIADLISLKKRKSHFRTYTYSYWGYKKLLRQAGFSDIEIDIPYPNYREIIRILLSDNLLKQKHVYFNVSSFRKRVENLFYRTPLIKYLSHAYLVHSNAKTGGLLDTILELKGENRKNVIKIINQSHKCTILIETENYIYKVPTAPTGSINLKREVDIVHGLLQDVDLLEFLPKLECGFINGMCIQISQKEISSGGTKNFDFDKFFKVKEKKITKLKCMEIYDFINIRKYLDYNNKKYLYDRFMDYLGDAEVNCTFSHGDFHSKNVIPTNEGYKIIDWEFYKQFAPVEIDYINLILYEETYLSDRTYYNVLEELLEHKLKISVNNKYAKYLPIINLANNKTILLYCLQHQDFIIGRYEQTAFIPHSKDLKIRKIIDLLENFISR